MSDSRQLTLADMDPSSPFYQQAMTDMQTQQHRHQTLYKLVMQSLIEVAQEKEQRVEEEKRLAREISEHYLKAIVEQEQAKHAAALEQLQQDLRSRDLVTHLENQNTDLLAEKENLQRQLERLPMVHKEISQEWTAQQTQAKADFVAKLKEANIHTVKGADGVEVELKQEDMDNIVDAAFSSPDPVFEGRVNPAVANIPVAVKHQHDNVMSAFKIGLEINSITRRAKTEIEVTYLSVRELTAVFEQNKDLIAILDAVRNNPENEKALKAIMKKAIESNEVSLLTRIAVIDGKIALNDQRMDQTRAEMGRPTNRPGGASMGGTY